VRAHHRSCRPLRGLERPLLEAGFDTHLAVAWIAEGLLAYLSPRASDSLVVRATELSTPESRMGLTLASPERLRAWREAHPEGRSEPGDYVALWRSAAPAEVTEWLASHGWQAEVFDVAERSRAYGRPLEEGAQRQNGARLVDATRS
jgi:methyltransferase (TIGR00027 family)